LAKWGAFEFSQFGLTDWKPASDGVVGAGAWQIVGSKGFFTRPGTDLGDRAQSQIEWRFAPSQHAGAMTPQLLYRNGSASLSNSFLSVLPVALTGMLADLDIVARMFTPDACDPKMLHIYQGWVIARCDLPSSDFYMAALYRNQDDSSDVASIWRVRDNSGSIKMAARQLGNRIDWSKPWHCRFNASGCVLKARWWSCDAIEPENWDLRAEDDDPKPSGMIGFASTVHGGIKDNLWGLDWYAWSPDPDHPAPLYPDESMA
jgi:hypothetical protein